MLEGTANGHGELEGTEHEFSALDIYFEFVSFARLGWKMRDATNDEHKMRMN